MENKDTFGLAPAQYRKFRPQYPRRFFEYLASLCDWPGRALDCATGNGQAAIGLAEFFDAVSACDSSRAQVEEAIEHPRVTYRVGPAEALPFDGPFDLIAAAQGAHWFDLPKFYREVERVAKPGAVVAIWGYSYCTVDASVDSVVEIELSQPVEPYWAEGNRVIVQKYGTIPFPFEEIKPPEFSMRHDWKRGDYMAYLRTWSAVRRYNEANGSDPVTDLEAALASFWPADEIRPVEFDLVMRIGSVAA